MKSAKLMVALMITVVPMLASAQLKNSDKIVSNVPFQFVVGNKPVPAGQWSVQVATADDRTVMIRNGDAKLNVLVNISGV